MFNLSGYFTINMFTHTPTQSFAKTFAVFGFGEHYLGSIGSLSGLPSDALESPVLLRVEAPRSPTSTWDTVSPWQNSVLSDTFRTAGTARSTSLLYVYLAHTIELVKQ